MSVSAGRSEHENESIRACVDRATIMLEQWEGWAELRADEATTLLLLEVEAEQLLASDQHLDEKSAAESIALVVIHWWASEGRVLKDIDDRR